MIELTDAFIAEKNKLANKPIYLYELLNYDGASSNLYFAGYDEDVAFNSKVYTRFPISHEAVGENTSSEVDTVSVRVANISKEIQTKLEIHDLRGKQVKIIMVFANLLSDSLNCIEHTFYIDSYVATKDIVDFTCSSKFDLMKLELPARKFWRNHCTWKFKGTECAYAGTATTCNKTFQKCKELANQVRFGGFPSIPSRQIYVG